MTLFSRALCPLLEQMGIRLSLGAPQPGLNRVITFVGAGIYEEVLFRLVLCSALGLVLRLTGMPSLMGGVLTFLPLSSLRRIMSGPPAKGSTVTSFYFGTWPALLRLALPPARLRRCGGDTRLL
jgi:hypothetical protein